MTTRLSVIVLVCTCLAVLSVPFSAQEGAAPIAVPLPTADDRVIFDGLRVLADTVNAQCQGLPVTKQYMEQIKKGTAHFEKKYPGYTPDYVNAGFVIKK